MNSKFNCILAIFFFYIKKISINIYNKLLFIFYKMDENKLAKYDKLMEQRNNAVKKWNAKNTEKMKSYKKKYYDENKIKIISNVVNRLSSDPEKLEKYREYQKEYQKKYRERIKTAIAKNENDTTP